MYDLASITRGRRARPPRIILTGVEKIGKSTFAAGAENPIFIPVEGEEGVDDLDVPAFPPVTSIDEMIMALNTLITDDHDYQTVVIDSTSALEPIIWRDVAKIHNVDSIELVLKGYGKGYVEALKEWRTIMDALDYLRNSKNMACILIGHVKVKRFDDPTAEAYDQYQWDINDKASAAMTRWADFMGFTNTKTLVKKEDVGFNKTKKKGTLTNHRYLFTKPSAAYPAGGRGPYGRLPGEILLPEGDPWGAFMDAVTAACGEIA